MDPISLSIDPQHMQQGVDALQIEPNPGANEKSMVAKHPAATDGSRAELQETYDSIAENVESFLKKSQTDLQVEIDRETQTPVFKIIRRVDGEVIKEIPPREMLDFVSKMKSLLGAMHDSRA
jgi:uncharacterized FlaG/YvyC family protein